MRRLGHYEIQGRLGEGGMGEVLLARDRRDGRTIAVKLLAPELAQSEEARARFLAEARLGQRIEHPNLVAVHDVDEAHLKGAQRTLFMTMELAVGRELLQVLSVEEIPLARVARIADALLAGLDALHQVGYVHRDVKSGNVKMSSDGSVKLLDLGLAAKEGTRDDSVVGTLHYAAPEQLEGAEATPAADVYSVGVTLYQMLTGRLPFRGESAQQVLESIRGRRAKPIARLVDGVPEEMCDLVSDMTASAPTARPTLGAARERLESLVGQLEEEAAQAGDDAVPMSRFKSWLRRRRPPID